MTSIYSTTKLFVGAMLVAAVAVAGGCADQNGGQKPSTTKPTAAKTTAPAKTTASATAKPTAAAAAGERSYVGVKKCAKCHKSEKRGNQFAKWEASKHASAYKTLESDKAKETAKKKGIDDPTKSEKCLKCHVTAYGVDKKLLGDKFDPKAGVQCEACHGPGSDYDKMKTMKDRDKAIAKGLVIPDEKVCVKCHNEESPFYKKFDFKAFFEKIKHPVPKK